MTSKMTTGKTIVLTFIRFVVGRFEAYRKSEITFLPDSVSYK